MDKKAKKKNPLKLKACAVALSLWGLSAVLTLSSAPVIAAETASNTAQEQEAKALFNKGVALDNLHRNEEAVAAFNDVITRFSNSQDPKIQKAVAMALFNKGIILGRLDRVEQTRSVWKELVSYFWTSKDRDIQLITLQAQYRLPLLNMIPN